MRRFVVGTAGHVDHGKTTLVRALTGVDTDRLAEEKRRGITIELGFAPLVLGDDLDVSVIDVPGHRKLVHTMIAGAVGIELVLLVVAADEGVMPQTREHVAACELLGIRRAVVALTKIDRAEPEIAELAAEDVAGLLRGRFEFETVPVSAKTGEGIAELRALLAKSLASLPIPPRAPHARLAVDRLFAVRGAGSVVTGTLVTGELAVGTKVRLVSPTGEVASEARGLHVHDHSVSVVAAPTRLAVNLASVTLAEISRGDVLTTDPHLAASSRFDAEVLLHFVPKASASVEVHAGTSRVPGRVQILTEATEEARAIARIRLETPLVLIGGDRFVLRIGSKRGVSGAVIGGGVVLDAHAPHTRDRALRLEVLRAIAAGDATETARSVARERAPRPVVSGDLAARLGAFEGLVSRAADKLADRGVLVRLKDGTWTDRDTITALADRAKRLVGEHHDAHPLDRGLPLETLRRKIAPRAGATVVAEAIRVAAKKGPEDAIVLDGDVARLVGFVEGVGAGGPIDRVKAALRDAALKGLGEHALGELLGLPSKELKALLAKIVRDGAALVAGGQWFEVAAVDLLRARVIEHFASHSVLTIADFKALSSLGRKQAIPLLELFDREGISLRKGDDRAPGPKSRRV